MKGFYSSLRTPACLTGAVFHFDRIRLTGKGNPLIWKSFLNAAIARFFDHGSGKGPLFGIDFPRLC